MNDNVQKKIGRNKPPRVQITYDLETEGAIIQKSLPCIIGLISDLTMFIDETDKINQYNERKFVYIDMDNFNDVLKSFKPAATVKIGLDPTKLESIVVKFKEIGNFHPLYLIENIPLLKERYDKRLKLSDLKVRLSNSYKLFEGGVLLLTGKETNIEKIFEGFNFISEDQKKYLLEIFGLLVGMTNVEDHPIISVSNTIDAIDKEINLLLNQALHSEEYQKLEASWLGVQYLIKNLELGDNLKLRILNAKFKEVNNDLLRALDFDQSFLFQKLYEEEYGTYGGMPYTCLLFDHLIEKNQEELSFLHKFSEVVSAAHIPTSIGVKSTFFDLDDYTLLHRPRTISKIFNSPEYAKFKSFRDRDESRYVNLILPSFMGRIPFGPKTNNIETLNFTEDVSSHDKFCWTNSVYSYGCNIGLAFSRYNWFASIIGPENGGMVSNLPVYIFKTLDGDVCIKCPSETSITDRREKELSEQGFICLCHCKDCDYSVFFSGQSANKPAVFDKDIANSNARLSARFQYMLNCSRFAHYIKCIMRDKIGNFADRLSVEKFLTKWITQYVLAMDEAPQEVKAQYPLREAKITVVDIPGKPGCYDSIIYLRPHFQMEELTVSLRLVARIPTPGT